MKYIVEKFFACLDSRRETRKKKRKEDEDSDFEPMKKITTKKNVSTGNIFRKVGKKINKKSKKDKEARIEKDIDRKKEREIKPRVRNEIESGCKKEFESRKRKKFEPKKEKDVDWTENLIEDDKRKYKYSGKDRLNIEIFRSRYILSTSLPNN